MTVDHSNDFEVADLFERIKEENNGTLDILVNNAYAGVRLQTARPKRLVQQPDYYRHPQKVVVNNQ